MSTIAPPREPSTLTSSSGTLRDGYKASELGPIPDDWGAVAVGDLEPFITSGSRGWARYYSDLGSPFIRITNMSRESIYLDLTDIKLVKLPSGVSEAPRTLLREGDVLISITADIGIVSYVDGRVPKPAHINQHIALVRFNSAKSDSRFVSYFLASEAPQRLFRGLTDVGAKAGMSLLTIRKLRFAHPQLAEQRAIAAVLSDADGLISALDKLIAKKRALKLATMQQLLTGKTRLPGFGGSELRREHTDAGEIPDDWGVHTLGDEIERLDSGVSVNSVDDEIGVHAGDAYILKTSAVANGALNPSECKKVAPRDIRRVRLSPRADCIVISRMNTPELVGECGYVEKDYPHLFFPDRLWMTRFRAGSGIYPKWLNYLLSSTPYKRKLKDVATGTSGSMKNISQGALLALRIPWPENKEQRAIANTLSDMDAEIAALERRRDKTKAIKQGMMQALLTGRVRLVKPEVPA